MRVGLVLALVSLTMVASACGSSSRSAKTCRVGSSDTSPLSNSVAAAVPCWTRLEGLTGNPRAVAGARIFAASGCTTCHTYVGVGSANLGAPDLSEEGTKNKGVRFQIAHLKCPSCVTKGSPMPVFTALGHRNLIKLAVFLEASKGPK